MLDNCKENYSTMSIMEQNAQTPRFRPTASMSEWMFPKLDMLKCETDDETSPNQKSKKERKEREQKAQIECRKKWNNLYL